MGYFPDDSVQRIWMGANDLTPSGGTATIGFAGGGNPVYAFTTTTLERVACSVDLPDEWNTYAVDLWWANGGAGAGNVDWQLSTKGVSGQGSNINSVAASSSVTDAAGTQGVIQVVELATGLTVTDGDKTTIQVAQLASSTLGNDAWLYGIDIRKVS